MAYININDDRGFILQLQRMLRDISFLNYDDASLGLSGIYDSRTQYAVMEFQKENGILITEPFRADGLERILYKCPDCNAENKMLGKGTSLVCQNCGMKYSVEEAKKMMIEGTVDVQGTVKVDNSAFVVCY